MRKLSTALILCLAMVTLFVATSSARTGQDNNKTLIPQASPLTQTAQAEVVERLPDGDLIVRVEGVEYRAVSADHARRLVEQKTEADRLARENALLDRKVTDLTRLVELTKKDTALADAEKSTEQQRAERFKAMYDGEHALREQSEELRPHGRVSKFFDNPFVQIGWKVAAPSLQTFLSSRRC